MGQCCESLEKYKNNAAVLDTVGLMKPELQDLTIQMLKGLVQNDPPHSSNPSKKHSDRS